MDDVTDSTILNSVDTTSLNKTGSDQPIENASGKFGGCQQFDGNNDHVTVPHLNDNGQFTWNNNKVETIKDFNGKPYPIIKLPNQFSTTIYRKYGGRFRVPKTYADISEMNSPETLAEKNDYPLIYGITKSKKGAEKVETTIPNEEFVKQVIADKYNINEEDISFVYPNSKLNGRIVQFIPNARNFKQWNI